ncbi:MAG: tyrosine-type recombinase/integrase [Gemmatimonadota bacterium]
MRVYIGSDPETGKRTYITRTFSRKKDADAEATRLERAKDMGALTQPSKDPLSRYLTRWLDEVKEGRVRARTLHDYRGILRRYVQEPPKGAPPIGKIRLDRLTSAAFEALYAHLWKEEELSPRTLQYLHSILRQALGHAVRTGALPRNPTDAVKPPRQERKGGTPEKAMRAMSREEAGRFMEAAAKDEHAALWTVLLMGGIRPGEAFALTWDDVDLDNGRLHVQRSLTRTGVTKRCECGHDRKNHADKGYGACEDPECKACEKYRSAGEGWKLVEPKTSRARRVVVLPGVAVQAIQKHRREQAERRLLMGAEWANHGFVFTSTFGEPLDLANLYRRFKTVLEAAGLGTSKEPEEEDGSRTFTPAFRLYDLRHTCATLLLLAGENPKVVSERLGHASVTLTLDTYSHVLPSMQEASADKLEAMFGNAG